MATLEQEFEKFKALHKYAILKAKITQYYKDLEQCQILIPNFLRKDDTPEAKADRDIRELIVNKDFETFNQLYERAYAELAEVLD